jgi:hypothetical protein
MLFLSTHGSGGIGTQTISFVRVLWSLNSKNYQLLFLYRSTKNKYFFTNNFLFGKKSYSFLM